MTDTRCWLPCGRPRFWVLARNLEMTQASWRREATPLTERLKPPGLPLSHSRPSVPQKRPSNKPSQRASFPPRGSHEGRGLILVKITSVTVYLLLLLVGLTVIALLEAQQQWLASSPELQLGARCAIAGGFGGLTYCLRGVYL